VTGWFSVAADYAYGQETTKREHCRYWNYNMDAYCGVYQCTDYVTATSDFKTILTGDQSFLQDTFDTCDWRLIDFSALYTITAITKGATTTVTCAAGHGLTNGQTVTFWAVGGMSQINQLAGTVSSATATTFVVDIDSSAFSNFTSGGYALKQGTKPAIYWDGGRKHRFINCYAVSYAPDCVEIGFATTPARDCTFDFHLEGAQSRSSYRFLAGTTARSIYNVEFKADGLHCAVSYFSTNASGAGSVKFYGGGISVLSTGSVATLPLFDDATKYGLYAKVNVVYPVRAQVVVASLIKCSAWISALDDGETLFGGKYNGTWTPTITSASGTITTSSASGILEQISDNLIFIEVTITITTNGTGAGNVQFTLPTGVAGINGAYRYIHGKEQVTSGKMLVGQQVNTSGTISVTDYANVYPAADGSILKLSGLLHVNI
jgi:hypothetical protein